MGRPAAASPDPVHPTEAEPEEPPPPADTPAPVSGGEILGELSRLAVVFLLVALGNILFLFAALYFVYR